MHVRKNHLFFNFVPLEESKKSYDFYAKNIPFPWALLLLCWIRWPEKLVNAVSIAAVKEDKQYWHFPRFLFYEPPSLRLYSTVMRIIQNCNTLRCNLLVNLVVLEFRLQTRHVSTNEKFL